MVSHLAPTPIAFLLDFSWKDLKKTLNKDSEFRQQLFGHGCVHNFLNAAAFASSPLSELYSYDSQCRYIAIIAKAEYFSITEE